MLMHVTQSSTQIILLLKIIPLLNIYNIEKALLNSMILISPRFFPTLLLIFLAQNEYYILILWFGNASD